MGVRDCGSEWTKCNDQNDRNAKTPLDMLVYAYYNIL